MSTNDSSLKVAEFLLQIKAVRLEPNTPFTWASGLKSPIYCDNRKTLSYPAIRTFIRQELVKKITDKFGKPGLIAGVATGGIPQGVLVAQELGLPFVYVRPEAKSHGLGNQVEGVPDTDQQVVVVEDLISTGQSSLKAVKALRDTGCAVKGMIAIFSYEFPLAAENMKKNKVHLETLTGYKTLIEVALEKGLIGKNDLNSLKAWREDPEKWSRENSK